MADEHTRMVLPAPLTGQRGIGRGLAAILANAPSNFNGLRELPVDAVATNPRQPRRDFDAEALLALSESIRVHGVLQPVVVRPLTDGRFELVAGERRLRAAKMAALTTVPAVVRASGEAERLELALIENVAREDLNPIEEARACATLVQDLGLTKEELARRVGKSRVALSNLIRLLELPDEALGLIEAGELSEGHGRAILTCKDQPWRRQLAREAVAGGWSVRETERHARETETGHAVSDAESVPVAIHPDLSEGIAAAEDTLSTALAREVRLRARGQRFQVQFLVDDPGEAIALAEQLLERAQSPARRPEHEPF